MPDYSRLSTVLTGGDKFHSDPGEWLKLVGAV